MNIRYIVELRPEERATLQEITSGGTKKVRRVKSAQILLACDEGIADGEIARTVNCGTSTIYRIKKAFVEHGLEAALSEKPRAGRERKLTGREEAILVAVACSKPPIGRARWTLQLLADEVVQLIDHESLSKATVGRRLALAEKERRASARRVSRPRARASPPAFRSRRQAPRDRPERARRQQATRTA